MNDVTADDLMAHVAWLRRLARSLLGNGDDAADAAQDTLVTALQSPPDARGSQQAWFGRVLVNRIRSTARAERRRQARHAAVPQRDAVRTPEEVAISLEMQRQIVTLLMELGEPYRQVVFMRFFDDLQPVEIARRLDLPPGTVRWRLKTALDQLRARLDQGSERRWRALLLPLGPQPAAGRRFPLVPAFIALGVVGGLIATGQIVRRPVGRPPVAQAVARPAPPPRPPVFLQAATPPSPPPRFVAVADQQPPPCPPGTESKRAPFTAVRWRGDVPEVEVQGAFAELVSVDDIAAGALVSFAREQAADLWRKRFSEDLVEILCALGQPPGERVRVGLRDAAGTVRVTEQPMNHENRQRVWQQNGAESTPAPARPDPLKISPFTALRFAGDRVEVALQVNGPTLELVSLEGMPASRMVAFCRQRYQRLCEKRFAEDLVELLDGMGVQRSATVRLEVKDPRSGAVSEHRNVPMTAENRRHVWEARHSK